MAQTLLRKIKEDRDDTKITIIDLYDDDTYVDRTYNRSRHMHSKKTVTTIKCIDCDDSIDCNLTKDLRAVCKGYHKNGYNRSMFSTVYGILKSLMCRIQKRFT